MSSAAVIRRRLHDARKTMPDPGNAGTIVCSHDGVICNLTSAGAETRTLALPTRQGASIKLHMITDAGNITLTVASAHNELGATTFVFSDVGQYIVFESFVTSAGVFFWRATSSHLIGNIASATSPVSITDATTYTVLAINSGKTHIIPELTADCTITLPTAAAGLEYTFVGKGVAVEAQNWIFDTGAAAAFYLGGLAFADTDAGAGADEIHAGVYPNGSSNDIMTIVTPAPAGTRIHLVCDGTNWIVNGVVYSATIPTFADT